MTEYLVIRHPAAAGDPAEWAVVDDQGVLVLPGGREPLAALASRAPGRRVLLLAPALEILLTTAAVPVRGKARVLQALPFAMEEQLADEVEDLHFAAGDRRGDDRLRVAVVRRELLAGWLEALLAAGLDAHAVYSEAEGLDRIPGTAVLLVEERQLVLRDADGGLTSGDTDGLEALLELWLAALERDEAHPHLLVYLGAAAPADIGPRLEALADRFQSFELRRLEGSALPRLAANLAVQPGINLLQGPFARRSNLGRFWPAWRLVAGLLVAVGLAGLATTAARAWQAGRQAEALDQAVEQAFRYTFPDVRQVRDPRAQLQSRLRSLGQQERGAAQGEFLGALDAVARAMRNAPGVNLQGLDYRTGILELRLRAPNVEVLDRIQRDIAAGGRFEAEIQSANAEDDQVLGRLRIRARGA